MIETAWSCPICGPALVVDDGEGPYCIRHGTQAEIDDDPEYAEWHSDAAGRLKKGEKP